MRAVYRNPKELAATLRDLVNLYQDDLMDYDKLQEKVIKIIQANEERLFNNGGTMQVKIANIIGKERLAIINDIIKEMSN